MTVQVIDWVIDWGSIWQDTRHQVRSLAQPRAANLIWIVGSNVFYIEGVCAIWKMLLVQIVGFKVRFKEENKLALRTQTVLIQSQLAVLVRWSM